MHGSSLSSDYFTSIRAGKYQDLGRAGPESWPSVPCQPRPSDQVICGKKLSPLLMRAPKFSATVWPMSESVSRGPEIDAGRTPGPDTSSGTYSRL